MDFIITTPNSSGCSVEKKYLVIIPTYNEEPNIEYLVDLVLDQSQQLDILFVDDKSQDKTLEKIKLCQVKYPGSIHVMVRAGKLGLGSAYVEGFQWGLERKSYSYFIEMDADLSHNPIYLKDIFALLEHTKVVVGSRYIKGGGTENWNFLRKFISRLGS